MANPTTMSAAEREAFLAEKHVGVFSVSEAERGPCTVPVWYIYAPGEPLRITMGPESRKVRLLRTAGRAALCVQQDSLPYKYVSVEGPIEIVETDVSELRRQIAERYLGSELAPKYLASTEQYEEVLVQLRPERWWSADFSSFLLD